MMKKKCFLSCARYFTVTYALGGVPCGVAGGGMARRGRGRPWLAWIGRASVWSYSGCTAYPWPSGFARAL